MKAKKNLKASRKEKSLPSKEPKSRWPQTLQHETLSDSRTRSWIPCQPHLCPQAEVTECHSLIHRSSENIPPTRCFWRKIYLKAHQWSGKELKYKIQRWGNGGIIRIESEQQKLDVNHSYEILEHTKLIYGERNQNSHWFQNGRDSLGTVIRNIFFL